MITLNMRNTSKNINKIINVRNINNKIFYALNDT